MSTHIPSMSRRLAVAGALAMPLIGTALMPGGTARADPDPHPALPTITGDVAVQIAEDRLPDCSVIGLNVYYDEDAPMWFVETVCTDDTWRDLRIDGTTGEVIAINGDYEI